MNITAQPLIGFGQVRHRRTRPHGNTFAYPGFFLMLPLRALKQAPGGSWQINRPGLLSFHESDHGDGRAPAQGGVLAWLDGLLQANGIDDATGEVWLQGYPRVLGYAFKPVSFWFCHRPAEQGGALRAIVVEVNNTFGERHCYVLDHARWGAELRAGKAFHVSPFCEITGEYRFRFMRTRHQGREHMVARIDYWDSASHDQPLLQTSISGTLQPLDAQTARRALWRHPFMTLGVIARIHWQALRLWLKRVPVFTHSARAPSSPSLHSGKP